MGKRKKTPNVYIKARTNAIIMLLDRMDYANTSDVAARLGCSWITADKYLKHMHKKGMLKKKKFLYSINRSQLSFD